MRCCFSLENERNGEKTRRRTERVSSPTPSRTRAAKSSVLLISLFSSLSSPLASVVPAYKYCISAKKEKNESKDGRERARGGGEVKRNCFWQSTTDDDADAARHEYEDASQRFIRRDVAI